MHKGAACLPRDEILEQLKKNEPTAHDYASYIPVGNSAGKLSSWAKQGAEIIYLTSRRSQAEIQDVQHVLNSHGFPAGRLLFRRDKESYQDIAEDIVPDVLVEDDCESIGGVSQMTITNVKPDIKNRIKSIVIKEFGGIDDLADDIKSL
jgi:hypothetical protein